jgi:catechol 2,3-dioxygenase-like lactoylglutathione lyase family enzyme
VTYKALTPMLAVADLQRSIDFYTRALGFTVKDTFGDPPLWCSLEAGAARLMLDQRDPHQLTPAADPARSQYACYLYPDDVHAAHRRVTHAGFQAPSPSTTHYHMREFRMQDPDGHWLWIGQPLTR